MEKQDSKGKKDREFEKYLRELNDSELKDRETKIRREIDNFLTKPITIPDMAKLL